MKRNKLMKNGGVHVVLNCVLILVACAVYFGLGFSIGREFEASLINNESNISAEEKIVAGQIADESDFDYIGSRDMFGLEVVRKDLKYGLIKNGGMVIIEPKYDFIDSITFYNGMRKFRQGDLCGLLDIDGNVILEPKYGYISIDEFHGTITIREGTIFKTYKVEEFIIT